MGLEWAKDGMCTTWRSWIFRCIPVAELLRQVDSEYWCELDEINVGISLAICVLIPFVGVLTSEIVLGTMGRLRISWGKPSALKKLRSIKAPYPTATYKTSYSLKAVQPSPRNPVRCILEAKHECERGTTTRSCQNPSRQEESAKDVNILELMYKGGSLMRLFRG